MDIHGSKQEGGYLLVWRHQAKNLFDGSQSCGLGSTEENISDRIVAGNSVAISKLVVFKQALRMRFHTLTECHACVEHEGLLLYLVHVELAATKTLITLDRNKIWGRDLYQWTALVEAALKTSAKYIKYGIPS